jgi:hypothetical protein
MNVPNKFRPWKRDYLKALTLLLIGVLWVAGSLLLYHQQPDRYLLAVAMLCVIPIYYSAIYLDSALNRKRGKTIENQAKAKIVQILPEDWSVLPYGLLDGVGDIDLPLRLPNKEICIVEIKAWNRWSGFLRTSKAIHQVGRQRQIVRASYAVIWLPYAQSNYVNFHGRVLVVCGNARFLISKVGGIIKYPAVIKFVRKPSDDMRSYVKKVGFCWNKQASQWEGRCSASLMKDLRSQIADEGGIIVIDNSFNS